MTNPPGNLQSRDLPADALMPRIPVTPVTAPDSTDGARERLAAAIVAASRVRPENEAERVAAELRTSVGAYVAALRDDGATVEHAVISTKELLADTIGGPNIPPERRALAELVVSWGIDAYYDSPQRIE